MSAKRAGGLRMAQDFYPWSPNCHSARFCDGGEGAQGRPGGSSSIWSIGELGGAGTVYTVAVSPRGGVRGICGPVTSSVFQDIGANGNLVIVRGRQVDVVVGRDRLFTPRE